MDAGYVRDTCRELNDQLVRWRRALHRIPEIGIDLPETIAAVRKILEPLRVEFQRDYKGIGLLALIVGEAGEGPTIGIRADMDALEIEEVPGREYGSLHPGWMHACGHDAHMAIALGTASFLAAHRKQFRGRVKMIFQPGEESMDGARRMIEAGALENPRVDAVLGLHIGGIWEELEAGQIGVSDEPAMAAADAFDFSMEAEGGHGAYPHQSADPVLAAAAAILQLHTLVGRGLDPVDTGVVTVGLINGGRARNIIPTSVSAKGTVRALREPVREHLENRVSEIVAHTAAGYRCRHQFSYFRGAPPVQSDPAMVELVAAAARDILGGQDVRQIRRPSLAGEDVSLFLNQVPGCFFGLGASNPQRGIQSLHHCPVFDIDESVLWRGAAVFSLAALRYLGSER